MKKSILIIASSALIASFTLTNCNTPAEKVDKANENVNKAQEDLNEANKEYEAEIENYRKETSQEISDNDRIIAAFKTKIENEEEDVRTEYQKKIDQLEKKNRELKKNLDNYKATGKENWEKFKAEFNHDMDELGQALKGLTVENADE